MLEFLQANSSLPSLHPAIIHFPIVIILFVWLLRVLQLIKPRTEQFRFIADVLIVLAAAGAVAAWLSGREAVNAAGGLSMEAELAVAKHADLAGWATIVLIIAALIPGICSLGRGRTRSIPNNVFCGWVNLAIASFAVLIVGATADLGGSLVYTHGVGVAKQTVAATEGGTTPSGAGNLVETTATAVDFPAGRTDWQYVTNSVMDLAVSGNGLVALPGQWGDSVVESVLDPMDFEGTLTLVHRYLSPTNWEGFEVSTEGTVRLLRSTDAGVEVRDESSLMLFRERFTIRSSAVAEHFKGLVDDDVVAHGHGRSGRAGLAGLLIDGVGNLKIISLTATGTDEH